MKIGFSIHLVLGFLSLSSIAFAENIMIQSLPDKAEIYVRSLDSQTYRQVGRTPLTLKLEDLKNRYDLDDLFLVEIRGRGYFPYRLTLNAGVKSDIKLQAVLEEKNDYPLMKAFDKTSAELFEIQRLIRTQNYEEGEKRLLVLAKEYPQLSIISELLGNVYFIQKKNKEALESYARAFRINPENADSYKLMVHLENIMKAKKERKPASK
jgi:tetratricopeptide (TPR) repeat protein